LARRRLSTLGARAIWATTAIDRAFRRFDRLRSELVAATASDSVLDRFNDLAYGRTNTYRPDTGSFRAYLFPWEEQIVQERFPPPPARILVGGAGGGREALALARLGYEVVAFDPSEWLVRALASRPGVTVFRGRYEELGEMFGTDESFDAVVLGWGSFSHLRSERDRVETLRAAGQLTAGPILVSFLAVKGAASAALSRLRRLLPRRRERDPGDVFAVTIGFYHPVDEAEVRALAQAAGLEVEHASFDERDTNWPHVVLRARPPGRASPRAG
jgi:SAM-dependent methyltransferase